MRESWKFRKSSTSGAVGTDRGNLDTISAKSVRGDVRSPPRRNNRDYIASFAAVTSEVRIGRIIDVHNTRRSYSAVRRPARLHGCYAFYTPPGGESIEAWPSKRTRGGEDLRSQPAPRHTFRRAPQIRSSSQNRSCWYFGTDSALEPNGVLVDRGEAFWGGRLQARPLGAVQQEDRRELGIGLRPKGTAIVSSRALECVLQAQPGLARSAAWPGP